MDRGERHVVDVVMMISDLLQLPPSLLPHYGTFRKTPSSPNHRKKRKGRYMTASKGFTHSLSSLVSEGHNSHKSVEKLALAQPYANFGETRMQLFRKAF